jgi:fumarate reductase subunit C
MLETKKEKYFKRFESGWWSNGVFYKIDILEGPCCRRGKEVCVGKLELLWFVIKEMFRKGGK